MVCLGIQTRRAQRVAEGPLRQALIAVAALRVRHAVVALRRLLEHVRVITRAGTEECNRQSGSPNKCVTCRGPSRHVTLCLGDRTDALRESGAKRIADCDSDYRVIRGSPEPRPGTPPGPPPGPPGRGRPGGRPRPPRAPGGRPGRAGAGAPRGAPGTPRRGLPGTPKMGPFWGLYYYILILEPPFWGAQPGVHFWAPGGPGPPGGKKVHIFLGI